MDYTKLPELGASFAGLPNTISQVLEDSIVTGVLEPGERLYADEIAAHYGVSRIPVREAIRSLSANGWAVVQPRYGAYVREMDDEELRIIFEARGILEAPIAALAAQRRTSSDLVTLEQLLAEGKDAVRIESASQFKDVNQRFHEAVSAAAKNDILRSKLRELQRLATFYLSRARMDRFAESAKEHERIVDAIRSRNAEEAADLAKQHVKVSYERIQWSEPMEDHNRTADSSRFPESIP